MLSHKVLNKKKKKGGEGNGPAGINQAISIWGARGRGVAFINQESMWLHQSPGNQDRLLRKYMLLKDKNTHIEWMEWTQRKCEVCNIQQQ